MAKPMNNLKSYGYKNEEGKIVETFRTKFAAQRMKKQYEGIKIIKVEIVDLRKKSDERASKYENEQSQGWSDDQ